MVDSIKQAPPLLRRSSSNLSRAPTPPPIEDNPISLKVSKVLTRPIDDVRVKSALEALSEFYMPNLIDHHGHHSLRENIEQKSIEINRNFLQVFHKLTEVLLK
nr:773_t:CDS:1 [Entrophospora candida]CAG8456756.1 13762_t:CDS:1 [Entrophospora candida]